ncbi:Acetyltransferase (GNAT) family protein [Pseudobutyrivibrio sp. YE44]|nr:Acetyltransferase (GNAT) family protein [Pseudobutyrivibrio sp. YE44]
MIIRKNTGNEADIDAALNIYNSNKDFLLHHIGRDSVDRGFITNELHEMKDHGFISNIVYDEENPVGVLDYMLQKDGSAYLSLMMLDFKYQKAGRGKSLFRLFENQMINAGAKTIRIDVVNDHEPNVIPFWEKMGFEGKEQQELTWGDKTSRVLVMIKNIEN